MPTVQLHGKSKVFRNTDYKVTHFFGTPSLKLPEYICKVFLGAARVGNERIFC